MIEGEMIEGEMIEDEMKGGWNEWRVKWMEGKINGGWNDRGWNVKGEMIEGEMTGGWSEVHIYIYTGWPKSNCNKVNLNNFLIIWPILLFKHSKDSSPFRILVLTNKNHPKTEIPGKL